MSAITTHILDTSTGRPVSGVDVVLEVQRSPAEWAAGRPWRDRRRRPPPHADAYRHAARAGNLSPRLSHQTVFSSVRPRLRSIPTSSSCSTWPAGKRTTMCPCCSARLATARIAGRDAQGLQAHRGDAEEGQRRGRTRLSWRDRRSAAGAHRLRRRASVHARTLAPKLGRLAARRARRVRARRRRRFAEALGLSRTAISRLPAPFANA